MKGKKKKKEIECAVGFLAPLVAPTKLWAVCWGFLQLYVLCLNLHLWWKSQPHSHLLKSAPRVLLSLNVAMAVGLAGCTDRIELQRATHFQGAKNVFIPVFVKVSNRQNQVAGKEGLWCAWCQKKDTSWPTAAEAVSSALPGSFSILSRVNKDSPVPIPCEGPWFRSGDQNGVSGTAKLTWFLQKDAKHSQKGLEWLNR